MLIHLFTSALGISNCCVALPQLSANLAHNRIEQRRTGGGEADIQVLTPLAERVESLVGKHGAFPVGQGTTGANVDDRPSGNTPSKVGSEERLRRPAGSLHETLLHITADISSRSSEDIEGSSPADSIKNIPSFGDATEEEEEDSSGTSASLLPPTCASSDTGSARSDIIGMVQGSALGVAPGSNELQHCDGARQPQVPSLQGASLHRSPVEDNSDDAIDVAAYERRVEGMHSQMLGALTRVPERLSELMSVEESASRIVDSSTHTMEPIIASVQTMVDSQRDCRSSCDAATCR
uniref:uncharacterized protein n=1 Tax=Pristiophorus japonicus TaxID=55135 RepID=UPI00398F68A6